MGTHPETKGQGTSSRTDGPRQPPASDQTRTKPHWTAEILEFFRAVVGLPTVVIIILGLLTGDSRKVGIGAGIGLVVSTALRVIPWLRRSSQLLQEHVFAVMMPWLFTGVLTLILVFVILPHREKKQSNLLASTWLQWQQELEGSASKCAKDDASCIAQAVVPVLDHRPRGIGDVTGLASDVFAGQVLLANDNCRNLLNKRLGIGQEFLGTGFSEPVQGKSYVAARTPEYLVPNLNDRSPYVWVWQLQDVPLPDRKLLSDHSLTDVLLKFKPFNHADFSNNWYWVKEHLSDDDRRPILIRFGKWDPTKRKYSGCLGRPDATRVFMTSFNEVKDRTVAEAAYSSGYTVPDQADGPGVRLFVWVYAPTEDGQSTPATWGNVLAHFGSWVSASVCPNP